jgi:ATP-dependent DNA helicase RecG
MSTFSPGSELVEARARLRRLVNRIVDQLRRGVLPDDAERQHVDCKEEAGRRGAGGRLLPGQPHNLAAADALANEVACFANTPGGGALLVGVENATGALLGAALDADWLRHRIYERIEVAPAVEPIDAGGVRLLVLYVAEAREPVEGTDGKLRWRTGGHCVAVDRAEWWLHRQDSVGHDEMASTTDRTLDDAAPGALLLARQYLREGPRGDDADLASANDVDLLTRLGVRRPDGRLTQAGVLLFCPADRSHVTLSVLDVEGGDVLLAPSDLSGLSLLEQIAAVEARLDAVNTAVTLRNGFTETAVRRLPQPAVREAVLNGIAHRDWLQRAPVAITYVQADSALVVVSPGGFVGGAEQQHPRLGEAAVGTPHPQPGE